MTRTQWLAANLNGPSIEAVIDRRSASPLYRLRLTGSAQDAIDHADVIADSIARHARQQAVTLLHDVVVQDGDAFDVWFWTSSRPSPLPAADLAAASTTIATLVATYGAPAVIDKCRELARREPASEWHDWQMGQGPEPPAVVGRPRIAADLSGILALASAELAG